MNKFFNLALRQWLIAFLSLAILAPSLAAVPQRCERLEQEYISQLSKKFNPKIISYEIKEMSKENQLTESKAKGIIGEKYAREHLEKKTHGKVISLFTYFKRQGCNITQQIRGEGDQGLDDIFITLNARGEINKNIGPIFHEAKYNGKCQLILNKTQTICNQLSKPWIRHNLNKTTTVKFCFPDDNNITVRSCLKCDKQFSRDINWIRAQFEGENYIRTASVLCANGNLKFYKITSKK